MSVLVAMQGRLMELMSGGPAAAQPPASYRHLLGAASAEAFIVSIESVSLTQTAGSSQDHRCVTQRVHVIQRGRLGPSSGSSQAFLHWMPDGGVFSFLFFHVIHTHNLHEASDMQHAMFSVQHIWQEGS